MRVTIYFSIILMSALLNINALAYCNQSDDAIIKKMIAESRSNYRGNCPCPYSQDKNGNDCGRRSAWSKKGGAFPLCYPDDVTQAMMAEYCRNH